HPGAGLGLRQCLLERVGLAFEVFPGVADSVQPIVNALLSGGLVLRLGPGSRKFLATGFDLLFPFDETALPATQRRLGRDRLLAGLLGDLVEQTSGVRRLARFQQRDAVVVAQQRDPAGPFLVVAERGLVLLTTFVENLDG